LVFILFFLLLSIKPVLCSSFILLQTFLLFFPAKTERYGWPFGDDVSGWVDAVGGLDGRDTGGLTALVTQQ
jgi:hypothetical protein